MIANNLSYLPTVHGWPLTVGLIVLYSQMREGGTRMNKRKVLPVTRTMCISR